MYTIIMAFVDLQLFAQTLLYFVTFVFGFIVSIPIGVTNINFGGRCILYGNFNWKNQSAFVLTSSDTLNCNFPIYVNVFCCIFYSLGLGVYNSYAVHKSRADPTIASQMWVMPFVLMNSLVTAVVLITSCIISVGFADFCSGLTTRVAYKHCPDAQNRKWRNINTNEMFDVGSFYSLLTVAETASWLSLILWLGQSSLCILRFVRNRRLRASAAEWNTSPTSDRAAIANLEPVV